MESYFTLITKSQWSKPPACLMHCLTNFIFSKLVIVKFVSRNSFLSFKKWKWNTEGCCNVLEELESLSLGTTETLLRPVLLQLSPSGPELLLHPPPSFSGCTRHPATRLRLLNCKQNQVHNFTMHSILCWETSRSVSFLKLPFISYQRSHVLFIIFSISACVSLETKWH